MPALLDAGWRVRVLSRQANRITSRSWSDEVEVVEGDATSPEDLRRALDGVTTGYYRRRGPLPRRCSRPAA